MSQLDSGVAAVQHCADRDDSQSLAGVWVGAPAYSSGGWRAVFATDSGHRILLLGKGPAPIPGARARQLVRPLATGDGQRAWLLRSRLCGMARVHRVLELDDSAAPSPAQAPQVALAQAPQVALAKLRLRLSERLRQLTGDTDAGAVLRAVTLGEGSGVRRELWQQFQATGTVHLLVISGLHLGLVALVGGLLAGWCLRWLAPALLLVRPLQDWRWLAAWLSGFAYACLAGFAVSAQRALVMLALALLLLLSRKRTASPLLSLLLALALLLTWDPLAALAPGLWLSFAGVAILLLYGASAATEKAQGAQVGGWTSLSALLALLAVAGRRLRLFASVQIAISVALAAPLLLSAIAPSPLSLPANLLAVPLLGMGTVPLGLAGLLLLPAPALAVWPLELATLAAALALSWIEVLATTGRALAQSLGWAQPVPVWPIVLLASLAALLLLAPPGFPMRRLWPVLLLCLPLSAFWAGRGDAVLAADAGLELHLHSRGRDFAGELHFAGRRLHIRSDWRGLTFATDDRQRYGCFAVRWQVAELSLQDPQQRRCLPVAGDRRRAEPIAHRAPVESCGGGQLSPVQGRWLGTRTVSAVASSAAAQLRPVGALAPRSRVAVGAGRPARLGALWLVWCGGATDSGVGVALSHSCDGKKIGHSCDTKKVGHSCDGKKIGH